MTTAVWICDGEKYVNEAIRSAISLAVNEPNLWRVLLAPNQTNQISPFHECLPLSPRKYDDWNGDSIRYFEEAFDIVDDNPLIFFDTDTYVCRPLDGLVDVVMRYDVTGAIAPRRMWDMDTSIPRAFPEINIGVVGFSYFAGRKKLLRDWNTEYERSLQSDQAALRRVMWRSETRLGIIPIEYNFRFEYGGQVRGPVFVLHGRSADYLSLENRVNTDTNKMRAWHVGELT